ncbi:hypothetical protein EAO73_28015 [Streptomyces sp. col6]|nr:hypothetical protein EAO73_28015 [Streptomyces sp. col6]
MRAWRPRTGTPCRGPALNASVTAAKEKRGESGEGATVHDIRPRKKSLAKKPAAKKTATKKTTASKRTAEKRSAS